MSLSLVEKTSFLSSAKMNFNVSIIYCQFFGFTFFSDNIDMVNYSDDNTEGLESLYQRVTEKTLSYPWTYHFTGYVTITSNIIN